MVNPETDASIIRRIQDTLGKPKFDYLKKLSITDLLALADDLTIDIARTTLGKRLRIPDASLESSGENLLILGQAGSILGISRQTVWRNVINGLMPAVRIGPGYFIHPSDLEAYQQTHPNTSP